MATYEAYMIVSLTEEYSGQTAAEYAGLFSSKKLYKTIDAVFEAFKTELVKNIEWKVPQIQLITSVHEIEMGLKTSPTLLVSKSDSASTYIIGLNFVS